MTETRRTISRDGQGRIEAVVEPNRLVKIERDDEGRPTALIETTAPIEPTATAADLERLERALLGLRRRGAETLEHQAATFERLERQLAESTASPPPPTLAEFSERFRRLSGRLGARRDGSALHVAIATAAATIGTGDLARAVEVLRSAEDQP
jgi:hypothetical protein